MTILPINRKNTPKVLLVLPETNNNVISIYKNYIQKLGQKGENVHVVTVPVPSKGRMSKKYFEPLYEDITNYCELNGITTIATCIGELLRNFIESSKAFPLERSVGEAIVHNGYTLIPTINSLVLKFAPVKVKLLQKSLSVISSVLDGTYSNDIEEFINSLEINHPKSVKSTMTALKSIIKDDILTADIETTGLNWVKDRLLTISFSTNSTSAIVIDFENLGVKGLEILKKFIIAYKGRMVFHNVVFDVPFLVKNLFMKDLDDYEGMINGVNQFNLDDSMVMAYLCLNSTERPTLGLKDLAYAKYGAYDADIEQSKLECYPIDEVAKYNAMDTMATYYIMEKYWKKLKEENQLELYKSYYRKVIPALIKVKMTGLTIDYEKVEKAYDELDELIIKDTEKLQSYDYVKELIAELNKQACKKYNQSHIKQKTVDEFNEVFNPNSTQQKRVLLFDIMNLHHDKLTKTGAPATDKEVMSDLLAETSGEEKEIIQLIVDIAQASVIRNTFLKAFLEKGVYTPSGVYKLYGNYNLCGTASGRLSSNNINLQNLPSTGSKYAEMVQSCFIAEPGFAVGHSDYSSLEDRVLASLSTCKNKILEYDKNIDGHCFRASAYFKEELEDRGIFIDMEDVASINSLKEKAPDLRQKSKAPTFAMAYMGGTNPIMKVLKCSKIKAEDILTAYKELYPELDEFATDTIAFAKTNGYVIGFYGLKLRAPNIKAEDTEATSSMGRTLVNMRVQSSAMLTLASIAEFQELVEKHGLQKDIRVHATVYDSIYLFFRKDTEVLKFVNTHLLKFMCQPYEGQIVPNDAALDIGLSWANLKEIPKDGEVDYKEILKEIV